MIKKLLAIPLCMIFCVNLHAQIIWTGVKAGYNLSWSRYDDKAYRSQIDVSPVHGFNAGAAFSFRMKDRYFLHTEILYSTKGRVVDGPDLLHDHVIYKYVDVPLIYNVHFKGQLNMGRVRYFKWYAGIGPNFSYWLGGKGTIEHIETFDFEHPQLDYTLKLGFRAEEHLDVADYVYFEEVNRLQLGINIGGGFILEPQNNHKFIIDLRFELGHSWLARDGVTDFIVPTSYAEDLRARQMGGRVSLMYLIEHNLDKRVRNKGKSSNKQSRLKRR